MPISVQFRPMLDLCGVLLNGCLHLCVNFGWHATMVSAQKTPSMLLWVLPTQEIQQFNDLKSQFSDLKYHGARMCPAFQDGCRIPLWATLCGPDICQESSLTGAQTSMFAGSAKQLHLYLV